MQTVESHVGVRVALALHLQLFTPGPGEPHACASKFAHPKLSSGRGLRYTALPGL